MMTQQELEQYATAADKAKVFFDKFFPDGYFVKRSHEKGTYKDKDGKKKNWVIAETTIFLRTDEGKELFVSNSFAREEQGSSVFNEVNYWMTAFTKADSRAYTAGLGILIQQGMSSREEIESSEEIMNRNKYEKQVKRTPKVKAPSVRSNLQRLRIKFEEDESFFTVKNYKRLSEKTISILKKYGFIEVDKSLQIKKDGNEL